MYKPILAFSLAIGLLLIFCGRVSAGGMAGSMRPADRPRSAPPKSETRPGWHPTVPVWPGHPNHRFYRPYGHFSYYRHPVIIVYPYYYVYSYSVPAPFTVVSPFFCLAHGVGYASRVGMLDHLSGTHKIPLETAASFCPEENETCLVDGY